MTLPFVGGAVAGRVDKRRRLLLATQALFASRAFALAALALGGVAGAPFQSNTRTLLRHLREDRMRGRVMSLFAVSVLVMWRLGAFPMGWAAPTRSAAHAVQTGAPHAEHPG